MRKEIIPSIIANSQEELNELIDRVKDFAKTIQLDVMDGQFVQNTSFQFDFTLPEHSCHVEAHLMIKDPISWIQKHHNKIDTILVHIETTDNPSEIIDMVKGLGKRIGFALNPKIPVGDVKHYLEKIDEVLVMTVNPGFYGSEFLPEALDKVEEFRKLANWVDIEVDGGITDQTIMQAHNAGANLFISGSYIVKSDNPKKAYENLVKILEENQQ
ncbi:ribulose-phosphate 3-epimerase [Candidatus Woesearchaeota archaeon]|nr:ribulose-phosphate 3-epimerase [Candidatus Woesearchaeota archaeon]